jgi:hypothetical protein
MVLDRKPNGLLTSTASTSANLHIAWEIGHTSSGKNFIPIRGLGLLQVLDLIRGSKGLARPPT